MPLSTLLGHDVTLGGLGLGGIRLFDDDLACFDGGISFHLNIWTLEAQGILQEAQ
jgi:hypothetical protein